MKAVNPTSKVIVHISNGFNNDLFRYLFDNVRTNGARYDVVGVSLYPTANWSTLTAQCLANMNDMVARYPGKEVMVVETGMPTNVPIPAQQMLPQLMVVLKRRVDMELTSKVTSKRPASGTEGDAVKPPPRPLLAGVEFQRRAAKF